MAEQPEHLPGFSGDNKLPIKKEDLHKAWLRVYLALMIIRAPFSEERQTKLKEMQAKLAEVNELVTECLEE